MIDCPLVNYNSKDKKKGGNKDADHTKAEMDALALAWEKKRNGQTFVGGKYTLDDLFDNHEDEE